MNMESLALLVPGRPLSLQWEQIDQGKFRHTMLQPGGVKQFGISLMQQLLPGVSAAVYFSMGNTGEWEYLGALSNAAPSAIFHSPWATKAGVTGASVTLGVSLESETTVANLASTVSSGQELSSIGEIARRIALHLTNYLSSFEGNHGFPIPSYLFVLPRAAIDQWMTKLETKLSRDPDYLFR